MRKDKINYGSEFYKKCIEDDNCKKDCIIEDKPIECGEKMLQFIRDKNPSAQKNTAEKRDLFLSTQLEQLKSDFRGVKIVKYADIKKLIKIEQDIADSEKKKREEDDIIKRERERERELAIRDEEYLDRKKNINTVVELQEQERKRRIEDLKKIPPPPQKTKEVREMLKKNKDSEESVATAIEERLEQSAIPFVKKKTLTNFQKFKNKIKDNQKYSITLIILIIAFFVILGFTISAFKSRICGKSIDSTDQSVIDYNTKKDAADKAKIALDKSKNQLNDFNKLQDLKNTRDSAQVNYDNAKSDDDAFTTATKAHDAAIKVLNNSTTNRDTLKADLQLKIKAEADLLKALTAAQNSVASSQSAKDGAVLLQQKYQESVKLRDTAKSNLDAATLDVSNKKIAAANAKAKCVILSN